MGVAEPACKTSLISVAAQSPPSPRAQTTQTALYDAKVDQASPTQWTSGGSMYGARRQRSQESAAQFAPRSAQLTRGISPVLTKANSKPKLNQIWLKDKDISLPGMHTAILTRPIVLTKINWKIA